MGCFSGEFAARLPSMRAARAVNLLQPATLAVHSCGRGAAHDETHKKDAFSHSGMLESGLFVGLVAAEAREAGNLGDERRE